MINFDRFTKSQNTIIIYLNLFFSFSIRFRAKSIFTYAVYLAFNIFKMENKSKFVSQKILSFFFSKKNEMMVINTSLYISTTEEEVEFILQTLDLHKKFHD